MKRKKVLFICISSFLCLLAAFAVGALILHTNSASTDDGVLPSPDGLKVEDYWLSWNKVDGATEYIVDINGQEYHTTQNKLDVFEITCTSQNTIKVMALGDLKEHFYSDWSETFSFTEEIATFNYQFINGGNECVVFAGIKDDVKGKLIIPDFINKKPVTAVMADGFARCEKISGIIFLGQTILVNSNAFLNCTNLKRVLLPSKLSKIMANSFARCSSLYDIEIPDSVTKIERSAFKECYSLKRIDISENVSEIGYSAFASCDNIDTLVVDNGNPVYKSENNCLIESKTGNLIFGTSKSVIPKGVKKISARAFSDCQGLSEIIIPDGVTTIDDEAFYNCKNLKAVTFPSTIESIRPKQIQSSPIENVTVDKDNPVYRSEGNCVIESKTGNLIFGTSKSVIPKGVKKINARAFSDCQGLSEIIIPNGVTTIDDEAFYNCKNLKAVTFPSTIESIRPKQIQSSPIENVTVDKDNPVYRSEGNCVIESKMSKLVFGSLASAIPKGVKIIGEDAFLNTWITSIKIPFSVEIIENSAFYGCTLLKDVVFNEGLIEIGEKAFYLCEALERVVIPNSVKDIKSLAFCDCPVSVVLADNVNVAEDSFGTFLFNPAGSSAIYTTKKLDTDTIKEKKCVCLCAFGYDDDVVYVDSFVCVIGNERNSSNNTMTISISSTRIPYRKGYKFVGWSTDRTKDNIVSTTKVEEDGAPQLPLEYFNLPLTIPDGTVLYAVWEKEE